MFRGTARKDATMTLSPARAARLDRWLLLALLLVYFLAMIGARPLNVPDEGRYPEVAREMLLTGDFITPRNNGVVFLDKPALYYWLQALAMAVFGVATWSIRLMPALAGAAGVFITFLAVRRLYTRRAAWLAAMVLACQPLYFLSSQYADMNILVGMLITASLLAFLMAEHASGPARARWLLGMYSCAAAAFMTKGLIGVVFPLMIIGSWIALRGRWRDIPRYGLSGGLALVVLLNLPWYALVQRANPEFLHYFFIYQQVDRFADTGFNNAQPWWYYPAILAGGLMPWTFLLPGATAGLWRRWRAEGEPGRRHLFLLLWPWLIVLFFSLPESKISSYLLPAVPPLAVALGVHMDALLRTPAPARVQRLPCWMPVAVGTAFLAGIVYWKGSPEGRWLALAMGLQWLLAGIVALHWLDTGRQLRGWTLTAGSTALGLLLCIPLVPEFTQYSSSAALAARMRPVVTPHTLIVSYRTYLNDLPLYLHQRQRIHVVDAWDDPRLMDRDNWRREFYLGLRDHPDARQWLRLEAEMPALVRSGRPLLLIVRYSELAHIQQRFPDLHVWDRFDRVFLLSNMPPPEPVTSGASGARPPSSAAVRQTPSRVPAGTSGPPPAAARPPAPGDMARRYAAAAMHTGPG